ncbi:asparagine synthase (glutamine-hydrolyzing) [Candidatus Adlerbacteria bacterium RIFCSPLOWO2_01_FULL_51_16]|uniref:asparagine synthase (glutamine-hydrolyzing) n=1 Tax=Candidatus Adlerbacteria bacterium RIFCSPLOWO2_01_FULL_51_16 TaxID=1797243 RepID=A0A1F4XEY7_9BACT|nr:MAG: asparagine synthase (glutamine-hydrolyzing) [Candidatus Adlerbacteria bacterium RIFCSPLOWO2_01_FULL_51_16]
MCSINGFTWGDEALGRAMNEATKHRGPDATAIYTQEGITLAHNRLAILDLSAEANQPMHDASGRYAIVFNGQIYNFKELREELAPYPFKTTGDTEVILAAYTRWGKECVEHFDGMFALALWDKEKKELFVARDHQGIKPFFYWQKEGKFIFSSEIAGLLVHPIPRRLNKKSFGLYLQLLYPPSPEGMIEGVMKLPAASRGYVRSGALTFERYWNARDTKRPLAAGEWRERVEKEIDESVKRQLISDRPVGVYLSGGIDSSVVLDSVCRVHKNVNTFSVGFELTEEEQKEKFNADFDLARRTAQLYGARHHEVLFSASDAVRIFPEAVAHLGEPIANPTILPMYALAQFARQTAVVVLGGDGGDELFGGYERYRRSLIASMYRRFTPSLLRRILASYGPFRKLNTKGTERIALFMAQKKSTIQRALASGVTLPPVEEVFAPYLSSGSSQEFENEFMEVDRQTWLADESLAMTDTMTMSAGLEARVPLLGKKVVELAAQIPQSKKVSLGGTKLILKKAFAYRLPKYLFSQPKRGWFSPGAKWLRAEPFRSFAQEALTAEYYAPTAALFDWQEVQKMFLEHESGGYHLHLLWAILTFQVWARHYRVEL